MALDNKKQAYAISILFMVGIVVSLLFIEFTFAENPPTVEVSDPFPEDMEIKDVVAETNKPSSSSSAKNPIPKPTPPAPVNNNNSSEQLTDNKPDNSVSDPFGGGNGGGKNTNEFGTGETGTGEIGDNGTNGNGQGFGDPIRENNPKPFDSVDPKTGNKYMKTEISGTVCVEMIIGNDGKVINAKKGGCTTHPEEDVVKKVIEYVKRNVKYKAEPRATQRKAYYQVFVPSN
jgi:hypothetical protein